MAEARRRETWDHTSHLIAAVFNSQRSRKQRPVRPAQFHPFLKGKRPAARTPGEMAAMMGVPLT